MDELSEQSNSHVVRLVGGPWDGETVQFKSWQTFIGAPDPQRNFMSDGRYTINDDGRTASWRAEAEGSRS